MSGVRTCGSIVFWRDIGSARSAFPGTPWLPKAGPAPQNRNPKLHRPPKGSRDGRRAGIRETGPPECRACGREKRQGLNRAGLGRAAPRGIYPEGGESPPAHRLGGVGETTGGPVEKGHVHMGKDSLLPAARCRLGWVEETASRREPAAELWALVYDLHSWYMIFTPLGLLRAVKR